MTEAPATEILLKQSEEAVEITRDTELALDGTTIPVGKYLVRSSVILTPITTPSTL